ncbi:MAG: hypothetical protein GXO00_00825 [Candidatus Diapherotrites archaeon]|nr:hypothetical protein [Candidatus Diapherotrites archaeon]
MDLVLAWAVASTGLLAIVLLGCPYALRIALSKRLVWVCHTDGTLEPVRARLDGMAYKTRDRGVYEFEKEDVLLFGKKPCIIVYSPYSKALRPRVLPVLRKLKMDGIPTYDDFLRLYRIVTAPVLRAERAESEERREGEESRERSERKEGGEDGGREGC